MEQERVHQARISTAYVSHFDQSKELPVLQASGKDVYWPKVVRVSKLWSGPVRRAERLGLSHPSRSVLTALRRALPGRKRPAPVPWQRWTLPRSRREVRRIPPPRRFAPERPSPGHLRVSPLQAGSSSVPIGESDMARVSEAGPSIDPNPLSKLGGETSPGTSSSTSEKKPEQSGSSAPATESTGLSPALDAGSPSSKGPVAPAVPSSTASSTSGSTPETGPSQPSQQDSSVDENPPTPVTPETTESKEIDDAKEMVHLARQAFDSKDYQLAEELLDEADGMDPSLAAEISAARTTVLQAKKAASK